MKAEGDVPETLERAAAEFPYPPVYSFSRLIGRDGGREFTIISHWGDGRVSVAVLWQPQPSEYCLPLELEKGSIRIYQSHAVDGWIETKPFVQDGAQGVSWQSGPPRSPHPEHRRLWKEVRVMGHTGYMQEWSPNGNGPESWQIKGNPPRRMIYWSVDAPDDQYVHWLVETDPRIHSAEFVLRVLNELTPVYPD